MAYWNWEGSVFEYIKFAITLLSAKWVFERIYLLNKSFTQEIPVGWILLVIISIILLYQILWLLKWTNIWLKQRWKPEWLIIHWGIYLIIISIVLSINTATVINSSFEAPSPKGLDTTIQQTNTPNISITSNTSKVISDIYEEIKSYSPINDNSPDIENITLTLVNKERTKIGVPPLTLDTKLSEVARLHSIDMNKRNFFEHDNPDGEDPTERAIQSGYNVHKELGNGWYSDGIAENIGMMPTGNVQGYGYISSSNDVATAMMKSWMNSPGHRANILDTSYDIIGIGVVYDGYSEYYLTQDFK